MLTLKLARSQMQHKKVSGFRYSCLDFAVLVSHHLKCSDCLTSDCAESHHTSVEFLLPLMPYFVMGLWL